MPDAPHAPLPNLSGPYEFWLFENELSPYTGGDALPDAGDALAAVAEVDPRHVLTQDGNVDVVLDGAAAGVLGPDAVAAKPQIWRPAVTAALRTGARSLFLPLVLRSRMERDRVIAGTAIDARRSTPQAEHGFRLNGRLAGASLDSGEIATPRITADPRIAALAQRPEGPAPLCLLAVIDDGLAFAHPGLRDSAGRSRMECCWLQSARHAPAGGTVLFGREHLRQDIEALTARCGGDEERLYREAGALDTTREWPALGGRASHGAHVLALAAGARPGVDSAAEAKARDRIRLIGVELPPALSMDTVGFGKDAFVLAAFHYIFDRADRIAAAYGVAKPPLAINFSFGFTGGPHDGSDRLEAAIAALIEARGPEITHLFMPAGNHFQARLHGVVTAASGDADGRFDIPWRIQPDDRTSNYLELWLDAARVAAPAAPAIFAPDGARVAAVDPRVFPGVDALRLWTLEHRGRPVGQLSIDRFRGARWRVMAILAPTDAAGADWRPCPAGLWRIRIDAREAGAGEIACRIQRDQTMRRARHIGRQSYFDHPGDRYLGADDRPLADDRGMVFLRRFGTLNGLATHPHCTVVGGYRAFAAEGAALPAVYSSAGPAGAGAAAAGSVDMAAASDASPARPGLRVAGTRAGASGRLAGVSAAAPQATRAFTLGLVMPPPLPAPLRPPPALEDRLGATLVPPPAPA